MVREPSARRCLFVRREEEDDEAEYVREEIAGDRAGAALRWIESDYVIVLREAVPEHLPESVAMRGEKMAGVAAGAGRGALRRMTRALAGIDRAVLGATWYCLPVTALARSAEARIGPDLLACLSARERDWTLCEAPPIARRTRAARIAEAVRAVECALMPAAIPRWARVACLLITALALAASLGAAGRRAGASVHAIATGSFLDPFADVPEVELKRLLPRTGAVAFAGDEKGMDWPQGYWRLQNRLLPLRVVLGDAELRAGRVTHVVMRFVDPDAEARFLRANEVALLGRCRNGFAVSVRRAGGADGRRGGPGS